MHRTEGADYVLEGGKRRFIDQDLPTYAGTVDTGEFNNAVQEELCYLIEQVLGAGTCDQTVAADRSGGWQQLYTSIFQSAALTSSAVDNISLAKLSAGTMNITAGDYNMQLYVSGGLIQRYTSGSNYDLSTLTEGSLVLNDYNSPADDYAALTATKLEFVEADDTTGGSTIARTKMSARGLQYPVAIGGNTVFQAAELSRASFSATGVTWTNPSTGIYLATAVNFTLTGVPDTALIYAAHVVAPHGAGASTRLHPVTSLTITSNGGELNASTIYVAAATEPDNSFVIVLEYDASGLDDG